MTYKYYSTKEYKEIAPVAYRQWRAGTHCDQIHGYALSFKFEFGTNDLDARNWCVDYGSLRSLKGMIEDLFDHKLLVAEDDPQKELLLKLGEAGLANITMVEKTGCEAIADFLYDYINDPNGGWLKMNGYGDRVWCTRVEVRETAANMAYRTGDRDTWEG